MLKMLPMLAAAAALSLGACTTAQIDSANKVVSATITQFCAYYPSAHSAFQIAVQASNGKIGPGSIAAEAQAVRASQELCANPPADSQAAAIRVGSIMARFVAIEAAARKQAGT